MNFPTKSTYSPFLVLLISLSVSGELWAHGGRLNASGCHNNRKTGGYHCHRSQGSTSSRSSRSTKTNNSGSKTSATVSADTVAAAQKLLKSLGFYDGPIDGKDGFLTQNAALDFQIQQSLPPDGHVSESLVKQLSRAIDNPPARVPEQPSVELQRSNSAADADAVRAAQYLLRIMGLYAGPIDGKENFQTQDAALVFQKKSNLRPDGRISETLVVELVNSLLDANN